MPSKIFTYFLYIIDSPTLHLTYSEKKEKLKKKKKGKI